MGPRPLASATAGDTAHGMTPHVWCTSPNAPGFASGSVTMAYSNAYSGPAAVALQGGQGPYAATPRLEYFMTAPSLTGYAALLNGEALTLNADGSLRAGWAAGQAVDAPGAPLVLPPLSYGFVVFPAAGVAACAGV